jgi:hypothetical protein
VNLVYWAVALPVGCSASIATVSSNTSLEKPTAAIAGINAIMLPRRTISTNLTWNIQQTTYIKAINMHFG